mmetsp:Transcript_26037/g.36953  ORF Transcript_26037/g.36953 Transcript_26037/m.36953 type:complete len:472 (-) Transcript_26037:26-1441(-)
MDLHVNGQRGKHYRWSSELIEHFKWWLSPNQSQEPCLRYSSESSPDEVQPVKVSSRCRQHSSTTGKDQLSELSENEQNSNFVVESPHSEGKSGSKCSNVLRSGRNGRSRQRSQQNPEESASAGDGLLVYSSSKETGVPIPTRRIPTPLSRPASKTPTSTKASARKSKVSSTATKISRKQKMDVLPVDISDVYTFFPSPDKVDTQPRSGWKAKLASLSVDAQECEPTYQSPSSTTGLRRSRRTLPSTGDTSTAVGKLLGEVVDSPNQGSTLQSQPVVCENGFDNGLVLLQSPSGEGVTHSSTSEVDMEEQAPLQVGADTQLKSSTSRSRDKRQSKRLGTPAAKTDSMSKNYFTPGQVQPLRSTPGRACKAEINVASDKSKLGGLGSLGSLASPPPYDLGLVVPTPRMNGPGAGKKTVRKSKRTFASIEKQKRKTANKRFKIDLDSATSRQLRNVFQSARVYEFQEMSGSDFY